MKTGLFLAVLSLSGVALAGTTTNHIWVSDSLKTSYKAATWTDAAWWQGGNVPSNANDVAHLAVEGRVGQNGNWWFSLPNAALTLDSIADGMGYTMLTLGGGTYSLRTMKHSYNVARGGGTLVPTSDDEPLVVERYMSTGGAMTAQPAAGREVRVNRFGGWGRVNKTGAGVLSIDSHVSGTSQIRLSEGTLAIGGAVTNDYVRGAWFHVDATKTNLITCTTKADDSRRYITKVADADGGSVILRPVPWKESSIEAANWPKPWMSAKTVNGVRLIDFGALTTGWNGSTGTASKTTPESEYGPGGLLHINPEPNGVRTREYFFVMELLPSWKESNPTPVVSYSLGQAISMYTSVMANDQGELFKNDNDLRWRSDIRIDGMPFNNLNTSQLATSPRQLRVYSIAVTNTLSGVRYLGGAPGSKAFGGMRLAEMLIYTNSLTLAERRQNIDHLMRKWHVEASGDRFAWDGGTLDVRADGTSLSVGADKIARVNRLTMKQAAAGSALAKTGAGALVVNRSDSSSSLRVEEGAVSFIRAQAPIDDSAPAELPWARFDATQAGVFQYVKDGQGQDTDKVLAWQDPDSGMWMTNRAGATVYPTRMAGDRGLMCVDFGRYNAAASAANLILEKKTANGYGVNSTTKEINQSPYPMCDVFVVWHNPADTTQPVHPIGACYNIAFRRSSATTLCDTGSEAAYLSAEAAEDGVPFDPYAAGAFGNGAGGWHVLRLSLPTLAYWSTMASRDETNYRGGCRIGELIVYKRNLSADERRNTEAYLMKKWLGKSHPDAAADAFGTLTLAQDGTKAFTVDGGRVFDRVVSSGTVVKQGAGSVEIKSLLTEGLKVEDGTVTATVGEPPADLFAGARYHFDMSDPSTLTTQMDGDVERIVTWRDCRSTSTWTAGDWTKSDYVLTKEKRPSRVTVTIAGKERQVVDFGPYQCVPTNGVTKNHYDISGESSCFQLHSTGGNTSGWGNSKETFVVCRDTDTNRRGELVAGWRGYLRRGESGALFANTTSASKGLVEVDGVTCAYSDPLPEGWHVVSIATPSAFIPEAIGGDCGQGDYFALGGLQVAEVVSFAETNTTARHAQIRDYLCKKWLKLRGGYETQPLATVQVAAGETTTLKAQDCSRVGVSDLTVGFAGTDSVGALVVDGPLDLSALGRICVKFAPDCKPQRCKGVYHLVTATALLNRAAFADCVRVFDCDGRRINARLKLTENGIDLEIVPFGMAIIVR